MWSLSHVVDGNKLQQQISQKEQVVGLASINSTITQSFVHGI